MAETQVRLDLAAQLYSVHPGHHDIADYDVDKVFRENPYRLFTVSCRENRIEIPVSRFDDIIAETLRNLAANGKGIEINTSGLRQGFGDCFPSLKYVKMYRDLGGEIITVGSDSHTVGDIAANSADGIAIAAAAGFTRLACFKQRKPYFIDIE